MRLISIHISGEASWLNGCGMIEKKSPENMTGIALVTGGGHRIAARAMAAEGWTVASTQSRQ